MTPVHADIVWYCSVTAVLLFIIGFYCVLVSFNMMRALIGVEILIKAATLLITAAGRVSGRQGLAQALVITLIVIEIVVMVVAGGISLWAFRHNNTIDPRRLKKLKG